MPETYRWLKVIEGIESFSSLDNEKPLSDDKFLLVCHGTMLKRYGQDVAIKAIEIVKEKIPNIQLNILGVGEYELALKKYGRIYEEGRRNPELADVLLEDLKLKKRRDELVKNIKATTNEREKKKLVAELEDVVAVRFDLIVRRKQIAYERLLEWLEGLRKHIRQSRGEINIWRDEKFKNDNVKKRMQDLLEENPKFNWD